MWFFRKHSRSSVALLSVGSAHVYGAYAYYAPGKLPTICYTVASHIEPREGEELMSALLRTLDDAGTMLVERGAPVLRREIGNGRADSVLVSIGGSWQDTKVHTETINPGKPFVFTKKLLGEVVASSTHIPEDRVSFGETVVATILNGYEISDPYGKKANRAEVVIMSSTLDRKVTEEIRKRVRRLYHTHEIDITAFAPVTYAVLRDLYPHEKDFLVLDVGSEATDLTFVKHGLLADVGTLPLGRNQLLSATRAAERMTVEEEVGTIKRTSELPGYINHDRNVRFSARAEEARDKWLRGLADLLKKFAEQHPLPRTLFLITDPGARDFLKRTLDSDILHALWLSDEPLSILTVSPEHFSGKVRTQGSADADIFLSLLALYHQKAA
jgi:hypothetical protein